AAVEPGEMLVVTSDRELAARVRAAGAEVEPAVAFRQEFETGRRLPMHRIEAPAVPVQGATQMAADDQQSAMPPERPDAHSETPHTRADAPDKQAEAPSAPSTSRVQQAAANIQQAIGSASRTGANSARAAAPAAGPGEAEIVARKYFDAINAHDLDAAVA